MHAEGDRQTVLAEGIARRVGIFDLHGRVALQANFAGEMKRGAFAVDGILREAVEGGERDEERREFRMIDELEVKFFLAPAGGDREIERNHGGRSAEFTGDGGEMVAGDGADRTADVDDFCGGER